MRTYYKATRLDETDFYSGTVKYEVGKTVRAPKVANPRICGPGYLHASNELGEVLIGGLWPCRLFEVTGKPHAGFNSEHRHKGGFKQLRVIRELDAGLALGPNHKQVITLLAQAKTLTRDQGEKLYAAWSAARGAARDAAWCAAWSAAWGAARGAARDAARDAAWDAAWDAARDAARDAVGALIVRDLITPEQFQALYGLWGSVFGEPDETAQ